MAISWHFVCERKLSKAGLCDLRGSQDEVQYWVRLVRYGWTCWIWHDDRDLPVLFPYPRIYPGWYPLHDIHNERWLTVYDRAICVRSISNLSIAVMADQILAQLHVRSQTYGSTKRLRRRNVLTCAQAHWMPVVTVSLRCLRELVKQCPFCLSLWHTSNITLNTGS